MTVNDLIDRWLGVAQLEATTRQGYVGKIEKHLRPTIGRVEVGKLDAETIDSFYAALRRCKEHCGGRSYVEHRTVVEHDCAGRAGVRACRPHACTALSDGSIRVIHSILKTSLNRAVRWKWIAVNPISFVEPPPIPALSPDASATAEAAPPRCASTRPGSQNRTAGPQTSSLRDYPPRLDPRSDGHAPQRFAEPPIGAISYTPRHHDPMGARAACAVTFGDRDLAARPSSRRRQNDRRRARSRKRNRPGVALPAYP